MALSIEETLASPANSDYYLILRIFENFYFLKFVSGNSVR